VGSPRCRRRVEFTVLDHPDEERAAEKRSLIVDLCDARLEDRDTITRLLHDYLHELSNYRERAVGATNSAEYPYLDAYFSEADRHAFLIRHHERVVGFALIRGPKSTGQVWEVAEFYIVPERRRTGVGSAAIRAIWRRFTGDWELQVHRRNTDAVHFWLSCVKKWAIQEPVIEEIESADGHRLQLRFGV
jgi:predicted acetyltransferase